MCFGLKKVSLINPSSYVSIECHAIIGTQNQTLILCRIEVSNNRPNIIPIRVLRGHERSVECVSANESGTRIVSGSFDHALKVWNTEHGMIASYSTTFLELENTAASENIKRIKTDKLPSQVPMVTLASHRDSISGVKWSNANAAQVVTASWDHSMIVWDLELAGTFGAVKVDIFRPCEYFNIQQIFYIFINKPFYFAYYYRVG